MEDVVYLGRDEDTDDAEEDDGYIWRYMECKDYITLNAMIYILRL